MYKIVSSRKDSLYKAISEVEAKVNELKEKGWTEQGGVSVSYAIAVYSHATNNHYYTVAQAMVKNEE